MSGMRMMEVVLSLLVGAMMLAWSVPPAHAEQEATAPSELCDRVQIFYYGWYGAPPFQREYIHWPQGRHSPPEDLGSNYYPQLGPYSSTDSAVLKQHMAWLRHCHVGVIVLSWWGRGSYEDRTATPILNAADAAGIHVAFHLEPYIGQTPDSVVTDVRYILEKYGHHPAFYRAAFAGNRPIFYSFETTVHHSAAEWRQATDRLHAGAEPVLLIAQTSNLRFVIDGGFDGGYPYDGLAPFKHPGFLAGWSQTAKEFAQAGKLFIPSVGPGYNDARAVPTSKANPPESARTRDQGTGSTYERAWKTAMDLHPPVITVTSFNEWHEGSQIEPAVPHAAAGYQYPGYAGGPLDYLDRTAEYVRRYQDQLGRENSGHKQ